MGTNYYLFKKLDKLPANGITRITNGYIFENTYYPSLDSLRDFCCEKLHVGKSSGGWRFSLCIYPKKNINTLADWKKLFKQNIISDEYGTIIDPAEMLDVITNRSGDPKTIMTEEILPYCVFGAWIDTKHNLLGHSKDDYICDPEVTYDMTTNTDFN